MKSTSARKFSCAQTLKRIWISLAAVNTFVVDEDANHLRVMSTGTHDKAFMRSVAKKFPKTLLGLPWKIDFRIRVPFAIDLDINAGRGPINISGVEGNIQLSAAESATNLKLTGGTVSARSQPAQ